MTPYKRVTAYDCTCSQCGHNWLARNIPERCAKCKRRSWNLANDAAKAQLLQMQTAGEFAGIQGQIDTNKAEPKGQKPQIGRPKK